jgi:hypothetical protein
MIPMEERVKNTIEGFIMLKMTETSLLIIFDIHIIFLSHDFKENQLMRKDGSWKTKYPK